MGFNTKAFGTIYKRIRTGSYVYVNGANADLYAGYVLTGSWDNLTSPITASSGLYSSSFLNFPQDFYTYLTLPGFPTISFPHTYISTRESASNVGYVAVPWGSMACDLLWNVKTPKWTESMGSATQWYYSLTTASFVGGFYTSTNWRVSLDNTGSFFRQYLSGSSALGVASYDVTSSWYVWDAKFQNDNYFDIPVQVTSNTNAGIPIGTYNITSSFVHNGPPVATNAGLAGTDHADKIGYTITWPNTTGSNATSSIDGQYFDRGGGAAISRAAVSSSLAVRSNPTYANTSANPNLGIWYAMLKGVRLFYPTSVSGSGTTTGTDYWHKQMTGYTSTDMFNENGGIYNVQFTLKRHIASDHYPDSGSCMNVFIHDVATKTPPTPSQRIAGTKGWYPPANNIVTIGHAYNGGPAMSFYDQQTGYMYERFNINLVQYGTPAQLCFEPSGSTTNNAYFGIIIDDVSICKIGVTTDPRFIKPATVASSVYYEYQNDIPTIPAER